jgi:Leucine-rich repeat (LRR) protein
MIEELYLFDNKLKGTIPEGISSMTRLRNIDVERNSFTGHPLVKLYNLKNLRQVHLSDNQFDEQLSGPGLANLELVNELWIGNNLFRGIIPEEIGKMESLGKVSTMMNATSKSYIHNCVSHTIITNTLLLLFYSFTSPIWK